MKQTLVAFMATLATVVGFGESAALAQAQRAPVPVVLPKAPPVSNQTSSALFDAMLAISRAQQANPQAAQAASFQYYKAAQQYRSGDFAGARRSALESISTASQPQTPGGVTPPGPVPALVGAPVQRPGLQGGLYGADAPAIDADSFLALARGLIADCAARHDPALGLAQRRYAQAAQDFATGNYEGTRITAKAAIDACAKPQK